MIDLTNNEAPLYFQEIIIGTSQYQEKPKVALRLSLMDFELAHERVAPHGLEEDEENQEVDLEDAEEEDDAEDQLEEEEAES